MILALSAFEAHAVGPRARLPSPLWISTIRGPKKIVEITRRAGNLWARLDDDHSEMLVHGWYRLQLTPDDAEAPRPYEFNPRR